MPYKWDDALHRYRDLTTGRIVSVRTLIDARDLFSNRVAERLINIAQSTATGNINVQAFVTQMRQEIKMAYLAQYELGKGGRQNMTPADYGRVGRMLRDQYAYLNNFAAEMEQGKVTPGQAKVRAGMYAQSSTQAYEKGKAAGMGVEPLRLPQYPGDGRTRCRVNCKCEWVIVETETAWECTWKLNNAEHCEDCLSNAMRWSPLVVSK